VEQRLEVTSVRLPLVSFRCTYIFLADGAVLTSDSTLWYRDRDEVDASLAAQGCHVRDVRQAPNRPGRELVFIVERTPPHHPEPRPIRACSIPPILRSR